MIRAVAVAAFASLFSILGAAQSGASDNEAIVVVTSFPEELTTRYEREFERGHPQSHVRFIWKQSRDALAELAKPEQGGADVYWAPAPANFALLRDRGAFRKISVDRAALPGRLGQQQLSDPAGLYEAYDVAGYGIVANPSALAAAGLSAPRRWRDLASPEYARQLAMPIASKVGFSPALYDILLQSEGWDAGWRLLSEMAGEATLLDSGFAPTASVREGKAALALTIDFFAEIAKANGAAVEMIYPERTAFLPAHVAMTAASKHVAGAQAFIDFLLSTDGQRLMMERDSRRHPARPDAYQSAPQGFADPFALPASTLLDYDCGDRPPPAAADRAAVRSRDRRRPCRERRTVAQDSRRREKVRRQCESHGGARRSEETRRLHSGFRKRRGHKSLPRSLRASRRHRSAANRTMARGDRRGAATGA